MTGIFYPYDPNVSYRMLLVNEQSPTLNEHRVSLVIYSIYGANSLISSSLLE